MNGQAHGMATKIATPVVGVMTAAATGDVWYAVAAAVGCLAGLIIDPDLDCDSTLQLMNASRWRMMKLFWPLGYLWFIIWWPYAQIFTHRGISHMPVIGTLTRLVYLAIIPLAALVAAIFLGYNIDGVLTSLWIDLRPRLDVLSFAVVGLIVSDTLHWVMDSI